MTKGGLNVSLKGADDIFSTEESRQEQQREQVQQIPIAELHPFTNHPSKTLKSGLSERHFRCLPSERTIHQTAKPPREMSHSRTLKIE